jgi:hypothetical protein
MTPPAARPRGRYTQDDETGGPIVTGRRSGHAASAGFPCGVLARLAENCGSIGNKAMAKAV